MKYRISMLLATTLLFTGCVHFHHQTSEDEPHALVVIAQDSGEREQPVVKKIDGLPVRPGGEYRVVSGEHQIIILIMERFDETYGPWVGSADPSSPTLNISQSDETELSGGRPYPFSPAQQSLNIRADGWVSRYVTNSITVEAGWRYVLDGERVSKTRWADFTEEQAHSIDATGPVPVSPDHIDGTTPLHVAATCGQADQVELLLSRGAQPDLKDSLGATPLHRAVTGPTVLRIIGSMGKPVADADKQSGVLDGGDSERVLRAALVENLSSNQVAFFVKYANEAADGGEYTRVAELLINRGADINAKEDGRTPLHSAVNVSNMPMVELLIKAKADLNARNGKGNTALSLAVFKGNEATIKLLLEAGADPDIADNEGFTPLHTAVEHEHVDMVAALLARKADPNRSLSDGRSPLHTAARHGDLESMRLLLKAGGLINAVDPTGTSLARATQGNEKQAVKFLLENGAKSDLPSAQSGQTALHWAAFLGHHEIAEMLLQSGANVNSLSSVSGTPLQTVAVGHHGAQRLIKQMATGMSSGERDVMPVVGTHADYAETWKVLLAAQPDLSLCDPQYGRTALGIAASAGSDVGVDALLKAGADVNTPNKRGGTPLHDAVFIKERPLVLSNIVTRLISAGANIEARDKSRGTPLHAAANFGQPVMLQALLEAGAQVDAVGPQRCTPLHLAIVRSNPDVIRLLLENGADHSLRFGADSSALMFCAEKGALQTVRQLLEWEADVDAVNKNGFTPLIMAARNGHLQVIESLLNHSASIGITNNVGFTALHEAADRGHTEVVECLLKQGADPEIGDVHGATPLHVAANGFFDEERFYVATVKLLLAQGASVDTRRDNGQTPLHRTAEWGRPLIMQALLDAGADRIARDNNGKTALDIANNSYDPGLRRDVATRRKACEKVLRNAASENGKSDGR